jgi:hypothetical protein
MESFNPSLVVNAPELALLTVHWKRQAFRKPPGRATGDAMNQDYDGARRWITGFR